MGSFLIGILVGQAIRGGYRIGMKITTAMALFAISYAVAEVGLLPFEKQLPSTPAIADLIVMPSVVLLLLAAASADLIEGRARLRSRWLIRLGEASFALYITHYLVLMVVRRLVPAAPAGVELVEFVACTAGCILQSVAAFVYVERPLERAIRRWIGTPAPALNPPL